MNKKTSIKAALTAGVLAAGATLALATPASAIVTETDTILIDGDGFDFGGTGWSGGAPTQDAEIQWDQAWFSVIPRVVGTMHSRTWAPSAHASG